MNQRPPSNHNENRSLGLGMLIAGFAVGLGLLTLFFDGFLDRQHNPNQRPLSQASVDGGVEVILQRNR
jgi:hypothetical protein